MKILFLAAVYEYGGVSSVIRNMIDSFNDGKIGIVFVVEKLGVEHYPISDSVKFINLDIKPARTLLGKIRNMFRHLCRIRRTIVCEGPYAVVSFGFSINCLLLLSLLWPGKHLPKIILTEHTEELFVRVKKIGFKQAFFNFIYKNIIGLLYNRADYIVTVSNSIAKRIKESFYIPSVKVKVIYNPINIKRINELRKEMDLLVPLEDKLPCVGTVSRLALEKGVNFLLEGFSSVLKKMDARLIIVGDGAERVRLEKMAEDLDIKDRIIFTGWVSNPFKYLAKMDVFILSSLWEGFPNVILEAMSCGVPVIASDSTGGVREIIKNEINGLLIKPGSSTAVSEAIYDLLSNRQKRENLIEEAYRTVSRFDIGKIKKQYEALIFN